MVTQPAGLSKKIAVDSSLNTRGSLIDPEESMIHLSYQSPQQSSSGVLKKSLIGVLLVTAILGASIAWESTQADFEVSLEREAPLLRPRSDAIEALQNSNHWKEWNHHLDRVEVESTGSSALGTWHLTPTGKPWKSFELRVRSTPLDQGLEFELLSDSTGRLTRLFRELRWTVRILEHTVQVTVHAQTWSTRARWLARWIPRILLNQALFADVQALGVDPKEWEQTGGMDLAPTESRPVAESGTSDPKRASQSHHE